MKKIFLILIALAVLITGGVYAYDYLRVKAGFDCMERLASLANADDLKVLDLFDDKTKVEFQYLYPDNVIAIRRMEGNDFKQRYHEYLTSDQAAEDVNEYGEFKVTRSEEGDYVVEANNFRLNRGDVAPMKVTFDGDRMDACIIKDYWIRMPTPRPEKPEPEPKPEENQLQLPPNFPTESQ